MDNQMTLLATASALNGAGLVMIANDFGRGLILVGVGTILTVLVAVLKKQGLDVKSEELG